MCNKLDNWKFQNVTLVTHRVVRLLTAVQWHSEHNVVKVAVVVVRKDE